MTCNNQKHDATKKNYICYHLLPHSFWYIESIYCIIFTYMCYKNPPLYAGKYTRQPWILWDLFNHPKLKIVKHPDLGIGVRWKGSVSFFLDIDQGNVNLSPPPVIPSIRASTGQTCDQGAKQGTKSRLGSCLLTAQLSVCWLGGNIWYIIWYIIHDI